MLDENSNSKLIFTIIFKLHYFRNECSVAKKEFLKGKTFANHTENFPQNFL